MVCIEAGDVLPAARHQRITHSRIACAPAGFSSTASKPLSLKRDRSPPSRVDVCATTGTRLREHSRSKRLICAVAAKPSSTGIWRSIKMRSSWSAHARATASAPSAPTSGLIPMSESLCEATIRLKGSSSTIKTRGLSIPGRFSPCRWSPPVRALVRARLVEDPMTMPFSAEFRGCMLAPQMELHLYARAHCQGALANSDRAASIDQCQRRQGCARDPA